MSIACHRCALRAAGAAGATHESDAAGALVQPVDSCSRRAERGPSSRESPSRGSCSRRTTSVSRSVQSSCASLIRPQASKVVSVISTTDRRKGRSGTASTSRTVFRCQTSRTLAIHRNPASMRSLLGTRTSAKARGAAERMLSSATVNSPQCNRRQLPDRWSHMAVCGRQVPHARYVGEVCCEVRTG